jgi:glycosyltransferase 2 family protein
MPASTSTRLARLPRSVLVTAQWLLAGVILYYVTRPLGRDWPSVSAHFHGGRFGWGWIALSGVIFLATYALLIETWRRVVAVWGDNLPWSEGARIWLVSNLGKYIPGKIWTITAMGVMARQQGVSPVAAAGSAIVMQLVSIVAGLFVVAATGAITLPRLRLPLLGISLLLFGALLAGPHLLARAMALASRLLRRDLGTIPRFPVRTVALATLGNVAAWVLYGVAFRILVMGLLGKALGGWPDYIALYTFSYISGFVSIFVPGGLGVREGLLQSGLATLDYTHSDAAFVAIASRLWLTVLEVAPGLIYYFSGSRNRTPT